MTSNISWYKNEGLSHISKQCTGPQNAKKALDFEGLRHFKLYMTRYAEEHALVLPGRIPGLHRVDPEDFLLLPSSTTKCFVCGQYNAARKQEGKISLQAKKCYRMFAVHIKI